MNGIPRQQPSLKVSGGATSMALHADPSQWHVTYLAVCHHTSNIQIYNQEYKVTSKMTQLKSSVLSAAFSLKVTKRNLLRS